MSWKFCFIRREVIREEHNICVIQGYFSEGFLNITEFLKGYPNKTLHPYTFLKTPNKRDLLGFKVKNYLIYRGRGEDIEWNGPQPYNYKETFVVLILFILKVQCSNLICVQDYFILSIELKKCQNNNGKDKMKIFLELTTGS